MNIPRKEAIDAEAEFNAEVLNISDYLSPTRVRLRNAFLSAIEKATEPIDDYFRDPNGSFMVEGNSTFERVKNYCQELDRTIDSLESRAVQDEMLAHFQEIAKAHGFASLTDVFVELNKLRAAQLRDDTTNLLYRELIMAVESKYPNESRHKTALRYIHQAEQSQSIAHNETLP